MKKNIILAAAAAASTILLSLSCTKQDEIQSVSEAKVFTASIEQLQTKTVLVDEVKVNWSEGDNVCIISTSDGKVGIYSATPKANGTAEFTKIKGDEPQGPDYFAVYPATLFQGEGLDFPGYQKYESGKLNAPMCAFSQTEKLTFKNMCGVVCFALTGSVEIGSIELWADGVALCGATEVNTETGIAKTVDTPSDENNRVILRCLDAKKNGVKLDTKVPTYFYICLPETTFEAGTLHASIIGVGGGSMDLKSGSKVTVEANNIYTFEFNIDSFDSEQDAPATSVEFVEINDISILPGEFTVDADGTKVKFTSGNLVYSTQNKWGLEQDPGQIISPFENTTGSVNLFLWHDDPTQARLGKATSTPSTHYLFCDGHKAVFGSEKLDITLSVLSMDQWKYILFERSASSKFARAKYNEMPGLLLFPDVLDANAMSVYESCRLNKKVSNANELSGNFPQESMDDESFENLKKSGFVFLPAEASRLLDGDDVSVDGNLTNDHANGYYWGVCDGGFAIMCFTNSKVEVLGGVAKDDEFNNIYETASGASIRLVQIIPAAQEVQGSGQTQRD